MVGIMVIIKQVTDLLPGGWKNVAWIYVTILISIGSLYIEHMEAQYIISSQRITLKMPIVTPYELDVLERFCVYDSNPVRRVLLDRKQICTEGVIKFFYDKSNPPKKRAPITTVPTGGWARF